MTKTFDSCSPGNYSSLKIIDSPQKRKASLSDKMNDFSLHIQTKQSCVLLLQDSSHLWLLFGSTAVCL